MISKLVIALFRTSLLHLDSHLQIPTVAETTSALTLARSNMIRLPYLIDHDDFFYLLHQHCRVTSLRIIELPCISRIDISENNAV